MKTLKHWRIQVVQGRMCYRPFQRIGGNTRYVVLNNRGYCHQTFGFTLWKFHALFSKWNERHRVIAWVQNHISNAYTVISERAINVLLSFTTTHLHCIRIRVFCYDDYKSKMQKQSPSVQWFSTLFVTNKTTRKQAFEQYVSTPISLIC